MVWVPEKRGCMISHINEVLALHHVLVGKVACFLCLIFSATHLLSSCYGPASVLTFSLVLTIFPTVLSPLVLTLQIKTQTFRAGS